MIFNTKTIEVLKSTGDIKLIPNRIQTLLVSLETAQERYHEMNDANYGMYLSFIDEAYLMNAFSIERKLANQDLLAKALDFKNKFISFWITSLSSGGVYIVSPVRSFLRAVLLSILKINSP